MKKVCTKEGCERKHRAKGLCGSHYTAMWKKEYLRQPKGRSYKIRQRNVMGKNGSWAECQYARITHITTNLI